MIISRILRYLVAENLHFKWKVTKSPALAKRASHFTLANSSICERLVSYIFRLLHDTVINLFYSERRKVLVQRANG